MRPLFAAYALAASAAISAHPVTAQVATVDEGTFTIMRGSTRAGREDFVIRQTPAANGAVSYVATATIVYTDRRLSPALRTDTSGAPLAYQVEVRVGDVSQQRLSGQVGRGRFSARVQTPRGESAREYVVSDGALILDDDIFHQYYFLARTNRSGTLPVVVPSRNVQLEMRVSPHGNEQLTIGGRTIAARRMVLSEPGSDREIWVDSAGRVLKVSIPARNLVAVRDDPPRP